MHQTTTELLAEHRLLRYLWRHLGRPSFDKVRRTVRVIRNLSMVAVHRPDYKRWTSPDSLEEWWDERTQAIAGVVPAGSAVIEFGAGRRQLEKSLPPNCTYTPSDLVDRGAGTIICDLNRRPLPDLSHLRPDVAVFGGVLEYICDVPALVQWLAAAGVRTCVASFDPAPLKMGIIARYREFVRRRQNGYMNSLTEEELLRAFQAAGFKCAQKLTWCSQVILVLSHCSS